MTEDRRKWSVILVFVASFVGQKPKTTDQGQPLMPATRKSWTRAELLLALNLYHKLAFGQLHSRNPAILALADKLGRRAKLLAVKKSLLPQNSVGFGRSSASFQLAC